MDYSENYSEKYRHATSVFKAMAHPLRVAILNLLKNCDELTVTQIHDHLNIPQAIASHHLNLLKSSGVLCSKKEGKTVRYSLKNPLLGQVLDCIETCNCSENETL